MNEHLKALLIGLSIIGIIMLFCAFPLVFLLSTIVLMAYILGRSYLFIHESVKEEFKNFTAKW